MPKITKEQFMAYRRVQREGKYNMMMDAPKAAQEAGLSYDTYMDILWNYSALCNMYLKH